MVVWQLGLWPQSSRATMLDTIIPALYPAVTAAAQPNTKSCLASVLLC